MRGLLIAALGCAWLSSACDSNPGASPSPSASAPTVAASTADSPALGLKASVNGEPLGLKTAVAFSRGGRGIELVFSTATPDCKDFAGNGRMLEDGEQHFSATIGPLLGKDGTESWGIGKLYFDSHTQQGGDLGTITVASADPAKAVTGEIAFELELKANDFMKKPARKLEVKGPFTAKGCGTFGGDAGPPKRPQDPLKLTVAGKSLSIQSAVLQPTNFPKPGHELVLSTAAASCEEGPSDADLTLKLNIATEGTQPGKRVQYAFMAGNVLSSQLNASPSDDGPTLIATIDGDLPAEGASEVAGGEIVLRLSGELDVLGYAVAADGPVSALRCAAEKK